jgi:CO/xanthine dehydrogenase Mo-binding subunit
MTVAAPGATTGRAVVGQSVPRVDGRDKVTGRARYVTDLAVAGMVHAKLWRSPVPHARIAGVDIARAAAAPGVLSVCTARDLPVRSLHFGPAFRDQPILAHEVVRHAGEPVVAVIADTEAHAAAALGLVDVRLDHLPAVTSLEAALAADAPLLHPDLERAGHFRDLAGLRPVAGTNVCHRIEHGHGDVEAGMARADLVVEGTFTYPALSHWALEPHCVIARAEPDGITVWSGTQHPFPVRKELAEVFGVPLSHVQVVVPLMGGAFGGKCYTKIEPLAAALSARVRRPVRLGLSAEESAFTISRHAVVCHLRTGVMRDGTLVAREVRLRLDTGAYADIGPRVTTKAAHRAAGPYRIPAVRIDARCVYTNHVPAGAYRGYGTPQVAWACESHMDVIAERLGLDPLELRLRNLLRRGEAPAPGDTAIDGDLAEAARRAAHGIGWSGRASGPDPGARPGGGVTGRTAGDVGQGLACAIKDGGGTHTVSMAAVRINADGSVSVLAGSVEIGQGARTVLAQIAAETLGVPVACVSVLPTDTALTPFDQGTSASRSTTLMGLAVQRAAEDARAQLLELAAGALEVEARGLDVAEGVIRGGARTPSVREVIVDHYGLVGGEILGLGSFVPSATTGTLGGATVFWESAAGAAEVVVDRDTGEVRVRRYVSVADVGRAINPRLCEGQDVGGSMQALGPALFEARATEDGQLLNPGLLDYRLPAFPDLPEALESVLIENGDGPGPFGAKGLGEGATFCPAAAVGNALARAVGVRITDLPLTPERVWRALRDAGTPLA